MELRLHIGYEQVLDLVKQLPFREKQQLTTELEKELCTKEPEKDINQVELQEFQEFLLKGPVMSAEQFHNFKNLRKRFNTWLAN